jgi:DNA repair exonuclease SbcCD ATPase subunit
MGFFTVGNLLTLGIVALVLILYRHLDKRSRTLDMVSKYAEKLKNDLKAFVEEQEQAVKGYGVELKVEKESAKQLMSQVRVTDGELAEKAAAAIRIEERLNAYDATLEELVRMTGRVQENLSRIRDESAFVEGVGKKLGEAGNRLNELEKDLDGLEGRFERENAAALERTAESLVSAVKSTVSDLEAAAETAERQVDEHRTAVNKIEQERAANFARDMEIVNKTLKGAVEEAGLRAGRMEEAALVKLKEQAQERVRRLQAAEEERLKTYQENARSRVAEVQGLVKALKEEWRGERQDWEAKDRSFKDEWKREIQELKSLASETEKQVSSGAASLEKRLEDLKTRTETVVSGQEALLLKAAEEMKRKALEAAETKLEEYRLAQDGEFRRLEALVEDSRSLDSELRRSMQEIVNRVKEEFALFERESAGLRERTAAEFAAGVESLSSGMAEIEKDLNALKSSAHENVSESLKGFVDDFAADLAKRSGDIDRRLGEWQENLETRLEDLGVRGEEKRRELELRLTEELRKELSEQNERIIVELDHLKTETGAFEESIRGRMDTADESLLSYREALERSLEEARKSAELSIKSGISRHSLEAADAIRQNQRDLEEKLREIGEYVETRNGELTGLMESSREHVVDLESRIVALRASLEEAYREADSRRAEILSRSGEQARALDSSVRDAERHIREFFDQAKLIDRADELKVDMERRIEDLRGDIDRLDQRRSEAAQLESEFVKIRRLEDEVNAKMTRFLSEKYRMDKLEEDFTRLLQTDKAVQEKLVQVTGSGDSLQEMQVKIRKIEDAMAGVEEKYQRIEKKNHVLDNTNEGIDRNFENLRESEARLQKTAEELQRLDGGVESLKTAIETLSNESEKARETADQISLLDKALSEIEERIGAMQVAREWIARTESRMEELNRQLQDQVRITGDFVRSKSGGKKAALQDKGAPSPRDRETIIKLRQQGWSIGEIAKTMKISQGEVELILEIAPKE